MKFHRRAAPKVIYNDQKSVAARNFAGRREGEVRAIKDTRGKGDQQPPQQLRNSRTMRMIQIQLLLSNTLHRQLFIVNLRKV